ncbi:Lysosomal alpha-glucosidase-like 2 [Homarus americanus]|uniref:Lysosomal alpha-glucosidase-like 2 n=1 Tax=Homarus americanus TaxID=6706 RepID=A0A8J5K2U2_HOMAM|nr:Lysosomal alpha-glucosidase-like 2 [Homarus americanus]
MRPPSLPLVLLLLAVSSMSAAGRRLKSLECPFPGGQKESSQAECAKYTACQWTEGVCHMRDNLEAGYRVSTPPQQTERGFKVEIEKINANVTMFESDAEYLVFDVIYHETSHVQVKIYNKYEKRYQVPLPLYLPSQTGPYQTYQVNVSDVNTPFHFNVSRKKTTTNIFRSIGPLIYEDQFLQITTALASPYMYGMGENVHQSFRHIFRPRQTFPIFSRGLPVVQGYSNLYGHHPYYMVLEDHGHAHSVLLYNSNAMEYSTFLLDDGTPALTLRTTGGIIDLHFFLGDSPLKVYQNYVHTVGYPHMPAYWSLGFQLSRYGYNSTQDIRDLRKRMKDKKIPQDPQIAVDMENYGPASRGKEADAFIKWQRPEYVPKDQPRDAGEYLVGSMWGNQPALYPDFLRPATQSWWVNEFKTFHQSVPFDAVWLDMNEPTNYNVSTQRSLKCPTSSSLDYPPYPTLSTRVGNSTSKSISTGSICMSTNQTDGKKNFTHYDVHSLYANAETSATHRAVSVLRLLKRPFVLTRSTFPGAGKQAAHWLGDNSADWWHMKRSIIGILEFNMFGIPLVGADICGFYGTANVDLCSRWMQLGAFYPLSRSHNNINSPDQDPTAWPEVAEVAHKWLNFRMLILPYIYSLFREAHMMGSPVVQPLFFTNSSDLRARDVDDQFMLGPSLMVAPILRPRTQERNVYFTKGMWYSFNGTVYNGPGDQRVMAPYQDIPLFFRANRIIPLQLPAENTVSSLKNDYGVLVCPDQNGRAAGSLYIDEGDGPDDGAMKYFNFYKNTLSMKKMEQQIERYDGVLSFAVIFGINQKPASILANGALIPDDDWSYDLNQHVLSVNFNLTLKEESQVTLKFH